MGGGLFNFTMRSGGNHLSFSLTTFHLEDHSILVWHRYGAVSLQEEEGETSMYLVMGITGKVGGATARHLLKQGKQVRALVRNREKAAKWADQRVELVDGDWNDATAIAAALKGVEGAFVMLPTVWAPSPDYKEAKDVTANYVEALTKVVPPRVVALSSMGANRTSGLGMITALSLFEQGLRSLPSPVAFVRAGAFFENFLFGYRPPKAEHYRSSTVLQTGNQQWSPQMTSAQRQQSF